MKKLLSTALILTLSLAVLLIFTGCNDGGPLEPEDVDLDAMDSAERAKFLLEASDRRLSAASSYEQTERVAFEIPGISGLEVLVETKVEGVGTKNYKEQTVTTTTTEDSYGAKTTEFETGGYADGYMYRNWTSAGYGNSVKSSLTAEEYLVHKKESIDLPDPEPRTYKSEKNEDGTWAIAILDFDDEFELNGI